MSEEFAKLWKVFLLAARVKQNPHTSSACHHLDVQWKRSEAVKAESRSLHDVESLTDNEGNALHYTAGYICHQLLKQLEWSNDEMKEDRTDTIHNRDNNKQIF